MNKIIIERQIFTGQSTIGRLIVQPEDMEGEYLCDTLEDTYRDLSVEHKIHGETAIPYGCYEATNSIYQKHGILTPFLFNVPNFEGIRLHPGNRPEDSSGCILVGYNSASDFVKSSKVAFYLLMQKIGSWDKYQVEIVSQKIDI